MTSRQDGGFFAGLKMSHLVTSQDFGSQDFLRAVCGPISQSTIAREPQEFTQRPMAEENGGVERQ